MCIVYINFITEPFLDTSVHLSSVFSLTPGYLFHFQHYSSSKLQQRPTKYSRRWWWSLRCVNSFIHSFICYVCVSISGLMICIICELESDRVEKRMGADTPSSNQGIIYRFVQHHVTVSYFYLIMVDPYRQQ